MPERPPKPKIDWDDLYIEEAQPQKQRRVVHVICPSCKCVVRQEFEEGISNTYRVDSQPCEKCRKAGRR